METAVTILSLVIGFTIIIFLIGITVGGLYIYKQGKKLGKEWNKIKKKKKAFDEAWNKRV